MNGLMDHAALRNPGRRPEVVATCATVWGAVDCIRDQTDRRGRVGLRWLMEK